MKNHNKTMDIKAITAKQIPDMSDDELQQAITHYGPKHASTAKLTKEANRRALVSKIKAKPQPTNGALPPALSAKLQEAHKAHGHDVTQATVQRAYDQALKEVTTGEGSNGGVKYKIKPTQMRELKQKLKRLENDLSLFGIQPTESTRAQTDQTQPQQEKQQATPAAAVNSDGINDHIRALRAVASKSIKQGGPRGDVRLSTDPSLYVPFEAAVAEARKAVANGVKPVPFQIHDALHPGLRSLRMKYKGHELEIQYLPGSDFTIIKDGTLKPRRPKPADIDFVWVTDPEGFRWVEKTVSEAKKEIDLAKFRRIK